MSGMPKPNEHHQKLKKLVGNWVGQEKLATSPVGRQDYTWYWVDSMGSVPALPARGKWEGDTLLFEAGTQGRYTYQFTGDNSMHFTIENSPDGGNTWATFMEANYRRA
jgi:hypothetical protein